MRKLWALLGVVAFWCSWPVIWLYLRGTKRTRLLIVFEQEFLVLRGWLGPGSWSLPGGGLRKGELPTAGLLRELHEETGLAFDAKQLSLLYSDEYKEYGLSFSYDCFAVELNKKPLIDSPRWEIVDYAWLRLQNPGTRLTADTRTAVRHWLSKN